MAAQFRPSHTLYVSFYYVGFGSVYMKLWTTLCTLAKDPHPQVSSMATDIVNYISNQVLITLTLFIYLGKNTVTDDVVSII